MKKNLLTLATILTIGFFSNNVSAQTETSATTFESTDGSTAVGARLIKPMSISEESALYFGTINILDGVAGNVVLAPTSNTPTFAASLAAGGVGSAATRASYSVSGSKNSTYSVTLPAGDITITETGTGNTGTTMIVNGFNASFNGTEVSTNNESVLSSTGADTFFVGATLLVGANQATGIYEGSFDVSVDYN